MTYATLSQSMTPSQTFAPEPFYPMSDAAEAERYAALAAESAGLGDTINEDLVELGLGYDHS